MNIFKIKKRDENQQLPGYLNFYDSEMPVAYRCFGFGNYYYYLLLIMKKLIYLEQFQSISSKTL